MFNRLLQNLQGWCMAGIFCAHKGILSVISYVVAAEDQDGVGLVKLV